MGTRRHISRLKPHRVARPRWAVIALVAAAALVVAACGGDASAVADTETPYRHQVSALTLAAEHGYVIPREFAGLVAPRQNSVLAFEQSGEIDMLAVDEGDPVTAGQLLATLDTRLLRAERDSLSARVRDLEARLDLNAANRRRFDELKTRGFAADQDIDELDADRRSLEAQLAGVQAELQANRTRVDQSQLVAPFDGAVARRLRDEGTVVAAGTAVFEILESAGMEVRAGVPVRLIEELAVGDRARLRVDGREVQGTVLAIGTDVTRATLTVPVRIGLPETLSAVAGDQAWLVIDEPVSDSGFWVPMTALTGGIRGLWNVYVVASAEDGGWTIEARDVRVAWADDERAFVRGAVADGERVVAAGLHRLVPGQRVRVEDARVAATESANP